MDEADVVGSSSEPITAMRIAHDLRALGVASGTVVVVHSSLSKLGWVAGDAPAAVHGLLDAVGPNGTIVFPTHSGTGEPMHWEAPPVPEAWWPIIREHTTPYDRRTTPTRSMGAIVECLRHFPGALRSSHPSVSAGAIGRQAEYLCNGDHPLDRGTGDGSPIARVYDLDGHILLLGVGHENNTSLHLAEWRATYPSKATHWVEQGAAVIIDGQRRWVTYRDLEGQTNDFEQLGADFASDTGLERTGLVGNATSRLMPQRALVDYAVEWMERHRV